MLSQDFWIGFDTGAIFAAVFLALVLGRAA
jgi:hypothetical protein